MVKQFASATGEGGAAEDKWLWVYFRDCLRLRTIAHTLRMRLPESRVQTKLKLVDGGYASMIRLSLHYLGGLLAGRKSGAAELGLIRGLMAAEQAKGRCR